MKQITRRTLLILSASIYFLMGCALAQITGENLTIGITGLWNDAKLDAGSLISDDKNIIILEPNAFHSYSPSNYVMIPKEIDFMWRIKGQPDKNTQLAKMKVRAKIPGNVLNTLHSDNRNTMTVEFFVKNEKPGFRWTLDKILDGGKSTELAKGEVISE